VGRLRRGIPLISRGAAAPLVRLASPIALFPFTRTHPSHNPPTRIDFWEDQRPRLTQISEILIRWEKE